MSKARTTVTRFKSIEAGLREAQQQVTQTMIGLRAYQAYFEKRMES